MGFYEIDQATGAQTQLVHAKESDWGVLNPALNPKWKKFNTIGGEGLDQNITLYRSNVIRPDGARNRSVRGSEKPGGPLPFELAPRGVSQFFYSALGQLVSTTGAGPYTHTLKRVKTTTGLPSMAIEKGFLDLPVPDYAGIYGCRVGGFSLNFNGDAVPTGVFDVMGREFYHSTTSKVTGTVTDQTSDPFTSVQITVYEGSSLVPLATCRQFGLSFVNNLFGDNIRLGSKFRANLKRGTVEIGFSGTFIFNSFSLFDKAVNGDDTVVQITVDNGPDMWDCLLPSCELFPNNSVPKIVGPGPLEVAVIGEALWDSVQETDMVVTITSGEDSIST